VISGLVITWMNGDNIEVLICSRSCPQTRGECKGLRAGKTRVRRRRGAAHVADGDLLRPHAAIEATRRPESSWRVGTRANYCASLVEKSAACEMAHVRRACFLLSDVIA
jgi:hypothetical protein